MQRATIILLLLMVAFAFASGAAAAATHQARVGGGEVDEGAGDGAEPDQEDGEIIGHEEEADGQKEEEEEEEDEERNARFPGLEDLTDSELATALEKTLVRVRRGDNNCKNDDRRQQGYGQQGGYGGGGGGYGNQGYGGDRRRRRCRKDMGYQMRKKIYKKAKMVMEMMKAMDGYGGYGYPSDDDPYNSGYFL